jgi:hypothetical protein
MKLPFFLHRHVIIVLLLSPILLFWVNKTQFNQQPLFNATQYQFTPPFFKLITFGFWPAAVDVSWIETVQLLGSHKITRDVAEEASTFYDLATDLDPNFYELYEQAGVGLAILGEQTELGIHFFQKGIKAYEEKDTPRAFWTHPYSLYIYLAFVEAYKKNDWAAAKKIYLQASYIPGAPLYLQEMREWLVKENSEVPLAKRVLKLLIQNATDQDVKKKYQEKLSQYE